MTIEKRSICECNSCKDMTYVTLTFTCKCGHINEYPFNIYPEEEYLDILEYMAEKRAAMEFDEYFTM